MNPRIEYVGFDGAMLVRETWLATSLHCPRCGKGQGHVWTKQPDASNPPLVVGTLELRLFICIGCAFAGYGWGGFRPAWNVQDKAQQIIKLGFGEDDK